MPDRERDRGFYLTRAPIILTVLSIAVVLFFLAVTVLSHTFYAQQDALGKRWYSRGVAELQEGRYNAAVSSFRTALQYARDNEDYQLNLAEALIGLGRRSEASTYLLSLWEHRPENGLVNLELARIAVQDGNSQRALRFFHNAIYATWPANQDVQRRDVRVELVRYLLGIHDTAQAQSQLIALAANLGAEPAQHLQVGELFLAAQDYEHALGEFTYCLKSDPRDPTALAGAGRAAFALANYETAQRYLRDAVGASPHDAMLASQLKVTQLVLQMDPYRRQLRVSQRSLSVMRAYTVAGDRLKACTAANPSGMPEALQNLASEWAKMKSSITAAGLRSNPERVDTAMELVFEIERRSETVCGAPAPRDMALLRIAQLHQGS